MAEPEPLEAGPLQRQTRGLESLARPLQVLGNEKRLRLLRYLTQPRYIREIASELGITRQSAQAHVDKLVEIGLLKRRRGEREHGTVTDYVVVPQRLYALQERFSRLSRIGPTDDVVNHELTEPLEAHAPSPGDEPVPRLAMVHGLRRGEVVALEGSGPWLVGRDPSAAVQLDFDPYVSTRHAEVRREDGTFRLVDLHSRNGTRVDWEDVERGGARELANGAVVGVGRTLLVFRTP